MSINTAALVGLEKRKGQIAPGFDAVGHLLVQLGLLYLEISALTALGRLCVGPGGVIPCGGREAVH